MIALDFQLFSVVLNIVKSDRYRHANIRNRIICLKSHWCHLVLGNPDASEH